MSALLRAALVGSSVKCLRSWDLRRIIWWACLRWKSRTSSKRGEVHGPSLCAQQEAGLVEAPRSGPTLAYDPAGLEHRLSRAAPPQNEYTNFVERALSHVAACLYHRINDLSFLRHAGAQLHKAGGLAFFLSARNALRDLFPMIACCSGLWLWPSWTSPGTGSAPGARVCII